MRKRVFARAWFLEFCLKKKCVCLCPLGNSSCQGLCQNAGRCEVRALSTLCMLPLSFTDTSNLKSGSLAFLCYLFFFFSWYNNCPLYRAFIVMCIYDVHSCRIYWRSPDVCVRLASLGNIAKIVWVPATVPPACMEDNVWRTTGRPSPATAQRDIQESSVR